MTAPITDLEKIRRLPWLLAGDTLTTAFFLLTFAGPVFVLFLDELGLNAGQIGLLLSLTPLAGIIAPFVAPAVARFGYKRAFVTFWAARKFIIALLLFTPAVSARYGPGGAFLWIAGVMLGFAICRSIAETGGYPWRKEAVPDSIRGKFTAINNMSGTVAGILVTAGASYAVASSSGLGRYMVLIATGVGLGLIGVWTYTRVPGGAPVKKAGPGSGHITGIKQALRDREFLLFLAALGLATFGGTAVISFIPLFMKEQVGLAESQVILLSVGTYSGALVSSYLWGWAADRYGSKPIMQTSLIFMMFLPVAWFLMPRYSPLSLPLAMTIAVATGIATLAWQISWVRYLYVNATPAEKKTSYLAVYYAWFGFINGFGPLLAGQIIQRAGALDMQTAVFRLDSYSPLFALSLFLLLAGALTVSQLRRGDATPFRRFAGMFLRGSAIRAIESLIQYNFSGDEMTRVAVAERMGDAQNPLSAQELIEAISDPSFNVRYEAVHSIGRMPPEPELVEALLSLLEGPESELSSVAARALGKLGDKRAIKPLRRTLFSGYRLLEANSARALAALGDTESIPLFLDRLRSEPNTTLRVAYASALGKLRASQAAPELFALLRQAESDVLRGEIGLALARIAGDERYYMQHWRSLRSNRATATAQALLALHKLVRPSGPEETGARLNECANCFARNDSDRGAHLLRTVLDQAAGTTPHTELACILHECSQGLAEFDDSRPEYILLALHALDIMLRDNEPAATGYLNTFLGKS